jgi:hypothetical protein
MSGSPADGSFTARQTGTTQWQFTRSLIGYTITVAGASYTQPYTPPADPSPSVPASADQILSLTPQAITHTTPLYRVPFTATMANFACPAKLALSMGATGDPLVQQTIDVCTAGQSPPASLDFTVPVFDPTNGVGTRPGTTAALTVIMVNADGTTDGKSYSTPVDLPPRPVWVAVGDSYTSAHHQDRDLPITVNPKCIGIDNGDDRSGCSLKWNDKSWSWSQRATNNVNAALSVPDAWRMQNYNVGKSGANAADYLRPAEPGCIGCGEQDRAIDRLQLAQSSWNVLSVGGGANDARFADVLKVYYKADGVRDLFGRNALASWVGGIGQRTGKPWAVSVARQCPNTKVVAEAAWETRGEVAWALTEVMRNALDKSPGLRIVDINYPYVVPASNPCFDAPFGTGTFGTGTGARAIADELDKTHAQAVAKLDQAYRDAVHRIDLRELFGSANPLPWIQLTRYYGFPHVNSSGQDRIATKAADLLTN